MSVNTPLQPPQSDSGQPPQQVPVQQAPQQVPVQQPPQTAPRTGLTYPTGQPQKVHHSYIWLSSLVAVGAVVVIGGMSSADDLINLARFLRTQGINALPMVLGFLALILIVYGIIVAGAALRYKNLSYVFDENEFSLYSGIITKHRVHVPYARVQSVNHRQSLIQRLVGVCTVEIDTAGGASNKAVKIPYVLLGAGEAIRQDLFMRKALQAQAQAGAPATQTTAPAAAPAIAQAAAPAAAPSDTLRNTHAPVHPSVAVAQAAAQSAVPGTAPADGTNILDAASSGLSLDDFRGVFDSVIPGMEPVTYERRLNNSELALASVSHTSVLSIGIGVLFGFGIPAFFALTFFPDMMRMLGAAVTIPLLILIMLIFILLGAVMTAVSFGNFKVCRRGSRLEVERGILQRDFSGIDVDRIQSIIVRQSLVRKLLGYCEVSVGRVVAVGENSKDQGTQAKLAAGGLVVHPFCKVNQVDELIDNLLPEFAHRPEAASFKGLPAVALRRSILRRCIWQNGLFWIVVMVALLQVAANTFSGVITDTGGSSTAYYLGLFNKACIALYVVYVLQVIPIIIGAVWWKRGSGFALNKGFAAIRNDGLNTETVWLPRQKIQNAFTRTNPFQRRAGTSTIGAVTAAGGGTDTTLWDVSDVDAASWLAWLVPRTQQRVLE